MAFNPTLHGLRGLAALMVLLFHWEQFYPAATNWAGVVDFLGRQWDLAMPIGFGWLGVHLFFVLSGFLLTKNLADKPLNLPLIGEFYFRRVMRIYPAVWLQLLVLLALSVWVSGLVASYRPAYLISNFLLWINIPGSMVPPLNGVWWTLPIELGFYLVLPLLILLKRAIGVWLLFLFSLGVTLAWRWSVFADFSGDNYLVILPLLDLLPGSLNSFVAGVLVSQLAPPKSRVVSMLGLLASAVGLVAMLLWQQSLNDVYWRGHWILVIWVPLTAIAIAAILHFTLAVTAVAQALARPTLVWLGEVSFGIYLWHFPVLLVMRWALPRYGESPAQSLTLLVPLLIATLLLAAGSFYGVERHAMRWRRAPAPS